MKKCLLLLGAALGFALLITGCDTDNSSGRVQEKSAVYATLKPWQKKDIDGGVVALTMTPDMVYMAIGNPSTKTPNGTGEVWIYKNYYPTVGADRVRTTLNSDQMGAAASASKPGGLAGINTARTSQAASAKAGPSLSQTGGPQGGSMEPSDMQSYTFTVTFENGVVAHLKIEPS